MVERTKRPWGHFDILQDSEYTKVKSLVVNPGQRLSYQSHKYRSELWMVVRGVATVTLNDVETNHNYGEQISVPQGTKHRLANLGTEVLEIIEIQVGTSFAETDIVRYDDDYNRAGTTT